MLRRSRLTTCMPSDTCRVEISVQRQKVPHPASWRARSTFRERVCSGSRVRPTPALEARNSEFLCPTCREIEEAEIFIGAVPARDLFELFSDLGVKKGRDSATSF